MYYAIIGDIVSSKKLSNRDECQQRLNNILKNINDKYSDCIASKFLITLGDEFQGLLHSPQYLLDIVETISFGMHPIDIRFGIGAGEISTGSVGEFALGSDGSAYHRAREVIEEIKKLEKRNKNFKTKIKFSGFDEIDCCLLNATAAGQYFIEKRWTQKQRELIRLIQSSDEHTQESISQQLGIAQSSVSSRLRISGYYDYLYMKESITKALCERSCEI